MLRWKGWGRTGWGVLIGSCYTEERRQLRIVVSLVVPGVGRGTLFSKGTFGNVWRHFWLSLLEGDVCYLYLVGRDQGCC